MILSELRDYLKQHRRASLLDMANRFDTDPEALRGMLEMWVSKGQVVKLPAASCDSGCGKCDSAHMEIYEWVTPAGWNREVH